MIGLKYPLGEAVRSMARSKYSMFGSLRPQDIKALGIGVELTAVIGGLSYAGYWLDERWGTDPWLLMLGVCIGTLGGGWHAIKMANDGKLPDFGLKSKPQSSESNEQEEHPEG